jgi:hypothetical protein
MLVGLAGYARSGKDTVANYLVDKHGFTRVAFADPMREALRALDPWISLEGSPHIPLSQALRFYSWEELKSASPDIRPLLQRFGTEVGRNLFGETFWVDQTMAKLASITTPVVISDVRFKNEAEILLRASGDLWYVDRPGVTRANDHVSESYLPDEVGFDKFIINDGSLDDLYRTVDAQVTRIKERTN